jgi:predicted MFS family arabinose efflux permease
MDAGDGARGLPKAQPQWQPVNSPYRLFLSITLPLAAVNLLNQASRTVMALIGPVMAAEFAWSASELGLLAACMYAAYAVAQLPVGVALDMFGPRRIQASLALLAALGFAVFAMSHSLAGFALARIILGVGVSAALMAIIKAHSQWFAPAQVAHMTGLAMVAGSLGSVLTSTPVQAILPSLGWRNVFWLMCGAAIATAAWIAVSVRDKPATTARKSLKAQSAVVVTIFRAPRFWRYAPAVAMLSILNFTYMGLWIGPWLRDVAGFDAQDRAQILLWYSLAMMLGGLVVGWVASRAQAHGWPPIVVPALCTGGLVIAQLGLMLQPQSWAAVTALWVLFAFCGTGGPAGYIAVGQLFPVEQTARVSTAINTLTLAGAFLLQWVIGAMLDLWPRNASGGWDAQGYTAALALSVIVQLWVSAQAAGWRSPWRRSA